MARIIAHLTDLTGADRPAFVHAAALAAVGGARLVTVHGNAAAEDGGVLPEAAPLAERWRRPIEHWRFCQPADEGVTSTLRDAVRAIGPDLVVTGTHARAGLDALFDDSVAEALARTLAVPTLVVPNDGRGFVDEAAGVIDLRRLLVPAADACTAVRGIAAARALLALSAIEGGEIIVLTVGPHALDVPLAGDVRSVRADGAVDEAILTAAREHEACAIVMPTAHTADELDMFVGSHTEHVIRRARRPVLTVPRPPRAA